MTRPRVSHLTTLVGIAGATAMLIALIWLGTLTATGIQRGAAEERLNANVANEAVEFEHQVQVDLTEVDQTLRILSYAWQADPGHFQLTAWRSHLVLLNEISPDMFIADEHGTVREATVPALVGNDVSGRDYFQSLSQLVFDDGGMFISPSTTGALVPEWHMNLARPLHRADGTFAGVIVAALRIDAMSRFYHAATIGTRGIVAVIGLQQGVVRVAVGPQPIEPGSSIAGTAMLAAMQADPDFVWVGPSPFDGIERVHGFRRVAGRDLVVVVGEECAEALRATETWVTAAYVFAAGITLLLVSLAAIIAYAIRGARRREEALHGERAILASANSELAAAKALADDKTMRLGGTLAGMSDGVSMIDGDLRLVEWNPRFPEIACVPADMLHVGLPMEDILRAQAEAGVFGAVDVETEVARRVADLRAGVYETVRERTGPDGRVVELRRNQLPDGGYVTLYSDVTARRESLNALREANALAEAATKAMSRFVAIVSHEIRTPLNVLLTSLGLLADSGMAPTQLVMLAMARQSGDALLALINDILEMSRMEAGRLALRPGRFALRPLIESVIDMFAAQAAERRIALRVSIADGLPDELYEDAGRLRQVLINLLSNAVKFAVPGEVRVIAEPRQAGAGRQVRLAVRDRGPVIDEASRARLFEPFSRLEDISDAAAVGTGLGLTICRHLVVLMDGEIGCSAWTVGDREAGNEFWLTLPVKSPPGDPRLATPQLDASPPRSLPRTRILLVEDIPASQLVTATLLRRDGHMVDVAGSGPEAVDAIASRPYDLVLMDNFMPGMNGLDAARRIRALDGPGAAVPIIALTADVCADDCAAYLAAGMQGILGKPVALRELHHAMGQHVWPHRSEAPQIELAEPIAETMAVSVLSTARLDELRMALPAARLAQLLEECLVDLGERLMLLQEAVRQQDNGEIVMHTHAMAGMAAEYGLAVLEARLRAVMRGAREAPDAVGALVDGLDFDMARTAAALHELFQIEMA